MNKRSDSQLSNESSEHVTTILPASKWPNINLRELWNYRELLFILAWRDVSVRYKQSAVGIGWAVIQPLTMMLIFTIVFGGFAKLPSEGVPYPIFTFCALLPWNYFASSLTGSSSSLVSSSHLVTKVYFPRLLLPLSKVFSGLIDFGIGFIILLAMMLWYGIVPTIGILFLPLFLIVAMLASLGVGLWLTAINVKYRDVAFVVPFMVQIWMYISPVAYSTTIVPERYIWIYGLNPMVGVIEGFRWAMLGKESPNIELMLISLCWIIVILVGGLFYFKKMEKVFADII